MDLNNVKELAIQGKDVFTLYVNNGLAWKKNHGFKVVAKQANSTIQITTRGTPNAITLVKSTDGGVTFSTYNVGDVITLANVGDSVIFDAGVDGNDALGQGTSVYHYFVMTGKFEIDATEMPYLLNQSGSVEQIPNYAFTGLFQDCTSLEGDVDLSWVTTGNASSAFRFTFRNTSINSIDLSGLTSISQSMFFSTCTTCTSLTSFDLSNLEYIGNYGIRQLFAGTSIENAELPKLAELNGEQAMYYTFNGCKSLKNVNLKKLSSVSGTDAMGGTFQGCTALEVVDFSEATSVPAIATTTFSSTNSTFQIVVPDALYSTWIAATNWSSLASQIVKVSDYTPAS